MYAEPLLDRTRIHVLLDLTGIYSVWDYGDLLLRCLIDLLHLFFELIGCDDHLFRLISTKPFPVRYLTRFPPVTELVAVSAPFGAVVCGNELLAVVLLDPVQRSDRVPVMSMKNVENAKFVLHGLKTVVHRIAHPIHLMDNAARQVTSAPLVMHSVYLVVVTHPSTLRKYVYFVPNC